MVSLPDPVRRSYLRQFVVVVLAVIATIAIAGVILQGFAADNLTSQADGEIERATATEAEQLQSWIESTEHTTLLISDYDAFQGDDTAAIRSLLYKRINELSGEYSAIHYVNTETGEVVETTDQAVVGEDMSDLGYTWRDKDGAAVSMMPVGEQSGVVMSDVSFVEDTARLAFAAPVDRTHAVVLTAGVNEQALHFDVPFDGEAQVVNDQGTVQIDRNGEEIGTTVSGVDMEAVERGIAGDVGIVDDGEQLVGYAAVEGTNWALVSHVPESTAYGVESDITQLLLILLGISVGGFVFLGLTIGRTTVRQLQTLSTKAEQLEEGKFDTEIESDRIDEFGQLFGSFGRMRDSLVTRIKEAEEAQEQAAKQREQAQEQAERAEQLATEAEERTERLEQRASEYSATMNECADGDLTRRLTDDSESEAMAEIAAAFNAMMADIEATMDDIQSFADEVATASEETETGASEVKRASEEVSNSIQTIAADANDQRAKLDEVSNELTDLSATIEEAASSAETVASTSQQTTDIAINGEETAQQAIDKMNQVQETMSSTVENVEALESLMVEIDEIVELIGEIAEQTNMLALNANIEAARAGEGDGAGDGFAVVADEVKQLAEETQDSAGEVAQLIDDVQAQTTTTVEEIRTAEQRVQETTDTVDDAVGAFVNVAENVGETNDGVQEISHAMDNQADSTQEVVTMVDDVTDISRSTASESENVSAAAEEQSSSMTQVTSNVETLADQAERLQAQLEKFTVGSVGD